ncbi:hypothetical protein D6789_02640 [Candidatus Woesearchaeota archaeon]|nr:MAG: hypothetical protein D6789_02640 [Candidatus Woesearchaeota archaeon]
MDIIVIVVLLLGIGNAVASYVLFRKLSELERRHRKTLGEISLNSKLSEIFAGNVNKENIYTLAHHLFQHAKRRYNLKAKSHDELIRELKMKENIEAQLRDALIDFFENLMLISYKKDNVSEEEKEALKNKIKIIVSHLQSEKKH